VQNILYKHISLINCSRSIDTLYSLSSASAFYSKYPPFIDKRSIANAAAVDEFLRQYSCVSNTFVIHVRTCKRHFTDSYIQTYNSSEKRQ